MPAASRRSGASFARFFIAGLGSAFLLMNLVSLRQYYLLKRFGTPLQATVTNTHLTRRRGGNAFNADYSFELSGKRYAGSGEVHSATYYSLHPGSLIAIRYVPASPAISESVEMSHNSTGLFLAGVLGLPTSFFILFMAFRKVHAFPEPRREPEAGAEETKTLQVQMPSLVRGIAFMAYPVKEMRRARRFYEEVLGLRAVHETSEEWIEYHLWDTCFALTSKEAGGVSFEVTDVDAFVDQLKEKGVRIKREPFSTPVCRMAILEDSEGNAVTLHKRMNA